MNDTTIIVLISVALSAVAVVWAVLKWNSRRSARYLMRATGVILMVVGAAFAGLTGQVVEWMRHLAQLTTTISIGLGLAALGLIAYFIGGAIKAPTKDEAKLREYERQAKRREEDAKAAAKADRLAKKAQGPAPKPAEPTVAPPPAAPGAGESTDPDDEVDNILRKHNIE